MLNVIVFLEKHFLEEMLAENPQWRCVAITCPLPCISLLSSTQPLWLTQKCQQLAHPWQRVWKEMTISKMQDDVKAKSHCQNLSRKSGDQNASPWELTAMARVLRGCTAALASSFESSAQGNFISGPLSC